jgi:hypothetical protein
MLESRGGLLPPSPRALAPPPVDQAARRHRQQPRPRIVRHALVRPLARGCEECLLHCIFTGVELPLPSHEGAEDLRRLLAQLVPDVGLQAQKSGGASITRRTSIGCLTKATILEAISIARCSFATSTIQ